jgi:hypothetical protein
MVTVVTVPVPTKGGDAASLYGVATYDPATHAWTAFPSTYDAARDRVTAQIPHFSWWTPFTWDWGGIFARVN